LGGGGGLVTQKEGERVLRKKIKGSRLVGMKKRPSRAWRKEKKRKVGEKKKKRYKKNEGGKKRGSSRSLQERGIGMIEKIQDRNPREFVSALAA